MPTQTNATLASLLGQDISVITVIDLRYEGKLYSWDTVNFTITLQNVRSMGTEQRVTSTQVPPSDEVEEYIVFNANYIKSFLPVSKAEAVTDPAIVTKTESRAGGGGGGTSKAGGWGSPKKKSSSTSTSSSSSSSAQSAGFVSSTIMKMLDAGNERVRTVDMNRLMGGQGGSANRANAGKGGQRLQGQRSNQTHNNDSGNTDGTRGRKKNRKQQQQQQQIQKGAGGGGGATASGRNPQRGNRQTQPNSPNKNSRRVSFKTDSSQGGDLMSGERRQFTHVPQIPRKLLGSGKDHAGGKRHPGQNGKTPASPRRQRSGSVPGSFARPKTTVTFDKEFDFESALEEFKELDVKSKNTKADEADTKTKTTADDEASKGDGGDNTNDSAAADATADASSKGASSSGAEAQESKGLYNKEVSFYDNLSTHIETEGQPRLSRKEVMLANTETFGVPYLPGRRNHYGGSRHGGYQNQRYQGGRRNYNSMGGQRPQGTGSRRFDQRFFMTPSRRMVVTH